MLLAVPNFSEGRDRSAIEAISTAFATGAALLDSHSDAVHNRTVRRLGPQRGPQVARVDTARRLATATWWMLTKGEPFAPADPRPPLVA